MFQAHPTTRFHRGIKTGRILRLHSDHLDFRSHILNVCRHPRRQTATPNRNEHRIKRTGYLP